MLKAELTSPPSWFSRLGTLARPGGKLSTDFVFAAASQVLGRGSLILASILVANFMTVESFSTFTYFNLTIAMIATFSTLGLGVAASRIFAESTVGLDENKRREARSVLFFAALSALVAVCALHTMPDSWLVGNVRLSRPVLYASVVAITINNVLLGAMSGRGEFGLMALAAGAGLLVLLGGVGAAVHFGSVNLAIWSVLISMTLQIGIFSTRLVPLLRARDGAESSKMDLRLAAGVMRIAGPMFLTSLVVGTVFWFLGRALMGGENGVAEFSKYAVGLQWFSFILLVPSITTRVFFPRIVQASVQNSDERRKLVLMNAGANFLVAAVLGAIAMALGDVFLSLYGNDDVTDVQVFRLFVLAAIVASPVNGLGNAIIARDPGPRRWLLLQVGWGLVAVLGALHFSATGTAASMAGALLLAYVCLVPSSLLVLKQLKLL
ncbi:MAG: hypothetical protein HKN05_02180 [Rhizobiales bacterium]|nr:hypothetical protein [Hyphomicrobiales bacterium]